MLKICCFLAFQGFLPQNNDFAVLKIYSILHRLQERNSSSMVCRYVISFWGEKTKSIFRSEVKQERKRFVKCKKHQHAAAAASSVGALMKEMPLKGNTIQPQGEEHCLGSQLHTKFSFT